MKLIGLIIAIILMSALFIWWISLSLNRTSEVMTTVQPLNGSQEIQVQTDTSPIDYSKEKIEEINQMTEERAKEK